jgi:acetyl-CoA acetyltransferase family protein
MLVLAALPIGLVWSSPFAKWGGALSQTSSLDLAEVVTRRALADRGIDAGWVDEMALGWTVPQRDVFYGAPSLAARLGAPGVTGPMLAQACATSVSVLRAAAGSVRDGGAQTVLAVLTDRTSNGPLLVYPQPSATGGAPATEHWVLDSFARDPGTGESMLGTAEAVAREEGIGRAELDELTALRHAQYDESGRGKGPHVVPVVVPGRKHDLVLDTDEGVRVSSREELEGLRPAGRDALHTFGSQTHPADGAAGAVVTTVERARELSRGQGVVELLGFGTARVEPARMPKAPVPAARRALESAGLSLDSVDLVTTHNPFAVNDVYFSRETGFPLDRMNQRGCSLVFGHPQGPTGMRSIAELVTSLHERGGGVGLFTGCAAGDSGAAVVLRVTD